MAEVITLAKMPPRRIQLNDKGQKFCTGHNDWLDMAAFDKRKAKLCDECDLKRIQQRRVARKAERELYAII